MLALLELILLVPLSTASDLSEVVYIVLSQSGDFHGGLANHTADLIRSPTTHTVESSLKMTC